jgi:hypothetical protein
MDGSLGMPLHSTITLKLSISNENERESYKELIEWVRMRVSSRFIKELE